MPDIISQLPNEILRIIMEMLDLHGLPLLCLSPVSSRYIKHLHFRNGLEGCWRYRRCPHSNGSRKADLVVYDLDDDDLYDLDDGDSKDDELDCLEELYWGTHPRDFDYLGFASGIIVNGLSHRQLRSFSAIKNNRTNLIKLELDFVSWGDGHGDWFPSAEQSNECPLLARILGTPPYPPSPVFPKLQELSISYAPIGPAFASALDMHSLVSLKLHYCDGWIRFVEKMAESSITLKLKTFEICDYESDDESDDRSEGQKAISDLLGSFSGLEKLHVFLGPPELTSWIPTRDFWASVLRHRATLSSCILDPLWGDRTEQIRSAFGEQQGSVRQQGALSLQRQNVFLQRLLGYFETKPRANALNLLDVECLGLINEPTCLRRILLSFAEKDCLRIIHIRTSMGRSWEWNWVWKGFAESEGRMRIWSGSYSGADLRALWPQVTDKYARYRLQDKFCAFVEWAFGAGGIASLRAIVVGDFSIKCDDKLTLFSICRNEDGIFTFLDGRDGRRDRALDDYRDFLASCR
ncbi:Protein kinase domain-containing protein [Fusarium sp. LHS14.1]|nr:Protein kinase domain-containing protein [Fusarium sp. LHS14.1]